MSVLATVDFDLPAAPAGPETAIQVLQAFLDHGWKPCGMYLPLGDVDRSNWQVDPLTCDEMMAMFVAKERAGEAIGVELVWQDSEIAGSFIFERANQFSVMLNCNRQTVKNLEDNGVGVGACAGLPADVQVNVKIDHESMSGRRYTNFGLYMPRLHEVLQSAAIPVHAVTLYEWG